MLELSNARALKSSLDFALETHFNTHANDSMHKSADDISTSTNYHTPQYQKNIALKLLTQLFALQGN